jgi:hypothetical protein
MTVCPGTQLPHVVVDQLVDKLLTASVYAEAYIRVVVGEGTDVAYLILRSAIDGAEIVQSTHRTVSFSVYENGSKW